MDTRTLIAALACTATFQAPAAHAADSPGTTVTCGTTSQDRATTRSETITRSQSWLDAGVPYSQRACHRNEYGSFRTDCSGYISMVWGLTHSRNTATLRQVAVDIPRADLRLGDALTTADHVALFVRWADEAKSEPVVREQTGPDGAPPVERKWSAATANTYTPIRYHQVIES